MKTIVVLLVACAVGFVAGHMTNRVIVQERAQTNLSQLSPASLSRLDELAELTEGYEAKKIDDLWAELKHVQDACPPPNELKWAIYHLNAAQIYLQVQRVGWEQYREVIRQNSEQFHGWNDRRLKMGKPITSPVLLREIAAADAAILEAFPDLK